MAKVLEFGKNTATKVLRMEKPSKPLNNVFPGTYDIPSDIWDSLRKGQKNGIEV